MAMRKKMTALYLQIDAQSDEAETICELLKAIDAARGRGFLRFRTTKQFQAGVIIEFGSSATAAEFIADVKNYIRKSIRHKIVIDDARPHYNLPIKELRGG